MNRSIGECNQLKHTIFPVYFQYVEDNHSAMEGLSERAYSAHSGLSRGAVQKALKNGRLVLFADGSINAAASDARRGMMTDPDQQLRSRGGYGAGDDGEGIGGGGDSGRCDGTAYLKARGSFESLRTEDGVSVSLRICAWAMCNRASKAYSRVRL